MFKRSNKGENGLGLVQSLVIVGLVIIIVTVGMRSPAVAFNAESQCKIHTSKLEACKQKGANVLVSNLPDFDSDGLPDGCDRCFGDSASADADCDGIPDACELPSSRGSQDKTDCYFETKIDKQKVCFVSEPYDAFTSKDGASGKDDTSKVKTGFDLKDCYDEVSGKMDNDCAAKKHENYAKISGEGFYINAAGGLVYKFEMKNK